MVLNIGVRGRDIAETTIEDIASGAEAKGFTHVQLTLKKALPAYGNLQGRLSSGMMNYLRDEMAKRGARVSVLGCSINMAQPVEEIRQGEMEYFREHIRYASDLGCKMVATGTGCFTEDYTPTELNKSEEAFETFLTTLKSLVTEAERYGVIIVLEGSHEHVVNTPKKMRCVLDIIDSENLQVLLDPVNFLNEDNYREQESLMRECFELFGCRINAIHLKDFDIVEGKPVRRDIGEGMLNYEVLLGLIGEYKPYIDVIIEETDPVKSRDGLMRYIEKFLG